MDEQTLLNFLKRFTSQGQNPEGGENEQAPEQTAEFQESPSYDMEEQMSYSPSEQAEASEAYEEPSPAGFDSSQLGVYAKPFDALIAQGLDPQEAYTTIMNQVQSDRARNSVTRDGMMQAQNAENAPLKRKFNTFGRTN